MLVQVVIVCLSAVVVVTVKWVFAFVVMIVMVVVDMVVIVVVVVGICCVLAVVVGDGSFIGTCFVIAAVHVMKFVLGIVIFILWRNFPGC